MGAVDVDDDTIRRFVLRRYAYDPVRHERRHIVVAVVDRRREFERLFKQLHNDLQRRRAVRDDVDPREHISGQVLEPGHLRRAANARLVKRALAHGVRPARLNGVELPASVAILATDE